MLAVDTNVVVRYLMGDDPKQSAQARAAIDGNEVFIGMTVILETEWVLRGTYGFSPDQVSARLRAFAGLPGISVENPRHFHQALDWMDGGMDFADAMHLVSLGACDGFLTFDKACIRAAQRLGVTGVRAP
jgi:predicted nucleic-acid-binding protein